MSTFGSEERELLSESLNNSILLKAGARSLTQVTPMALAATTGPNTPNLAGRARRYLKPTAELVAE